MKQWHSSELRAALAQVAMPAALMDPSFELNWANGAFERLLGSDRGPTENYAFNAAEIQRRLGEVPSDGRAAAFTIACPLADSTRSSDAEVVILCSCANADEPESGWLIVAFGVPAAAMEARARLAAIVESSGDAIISQTPEGVIVSWNSGAERIYGHRAEAIIGKLI